MASQSNDDLDSLLQGFKDKYQESKQIKKSTPDHQDTGEIKDLLSQAKSKFQNKEVLSLIHI